MIEAREKKLIKNYNSWVAKCLGDTTPEDIEELVDENIMGYGTTTDERIIGINEFKRLLNDAILQREHLQNFNYKFTPIFRKYLSEDTIAIIVDEIELKYVSEGNKVCLDIRISSVFHFKEDNWKVINWHGSVGVETDEGDTWHADEWKRENERLQQKVDEQTTELRQSLEHLKATQAQLIHSEKMASLGELTAGIAHEIQNPLNFVNNFSEVSNELVDEMNEELDKGDIEEAKAISEDIKQNLEKITHHGKRADGIVKGMLQHSRSSSGKKEPTDINKLTDEYFRLAYHGLRAKDKSFNATLETNFDETIGKIDVVRQDIGRVILNLFTNAFYAVDEKKSISELKDYKPTVAVTTEKSKNKVVITVRDNGNGIPKKALDKIFQPFFTTKPTGQGTGLGLSMSYDIIKAHKGELTVNTEKGKFTEFKISLPIAD